MTMRTMRGREPKLFRIERSLNYPPAHRSIIVDWPIGTIVLNLGSVEGSNLELLLVDNRVLVGTLEWGHGVNVFDYVSVLR